MLKRSVIRIALLSVIVSGLLVACGGKAGTGTLQFHANGEDFVRQGFVSKDGWSIRFDHVHINLTEITGYQADPPYDAHAGGGVKAKQQVSLEGSYIVDLAEGGEDADPILVGEVSDALAGQYNAISWKMTRASDGPAQGYSVGMAGKAEKDGEIITFNIGIESEYPFTCGEFVGDERKGVLSKDGVADLEMTFHFDHIFGDAEIPLDDDLNVGAPGFEPFAGVAEGGMLTIDMAGLQSQLSTEDYQMLVDMLPTLGHVGEGHCHHGGL